MMTKADVLAFIKTKKHAVISTCRHNHQPEAALIGFGQTEDLELIFGTSNASRKYKNLSKNSRVAFVIGWDDDYVTVQYEGNAIELSGTELEKYVSIYHDKVPSAVIYRALPDQTNFKVIPIWLRYSDLSGVEEKIIEILF